MNLTTQSAPFGATSLSGLAAARAAAYDPAPGRLKRYPTYAYQAGLHAAPFSNVEAVKDCHRWGIFYPNGRASPGAIRASVISDAADKFAYKQGQIERARSAMSDQWEADNNRDVSDFYNCERLATILIETAARATHASDGPASTLIEATDLVELAAEFVPIADHDDALFEAEQALRDYHWQIIISDEEADALEAARAAVFDRLPTATSIDEMAASLCDDFGIGPVDAEDIAKRAARSEAEEGNRRAAVLCEQDRLATHRWFAQFADRLATRGTLSSKTAGLAAKTHTAISDHFRLMEA